MGWGGRDLQGEGLVEGGIEGIFNTLGTLDLVGERERLVLEAQLYETVTATPHIHFGQVGSIDDGYIHQAFRHLEKFSES